MPSVGGPELIVILIVALLVLGPKRLPEAGRSIGRGFREFKDSISGAGDDRDKLARHPHDTAANRDATGAFGDDRRS